LKENLDEVVVEEKELQQQLHVCSQECDEAVIELSRLDEQNGKVVDKKRMLDEKITVLKTELENLAVFKRDDLEIISLEHKSIHENLQAEMNEKMKALQDEVKRSQTELNYRESEHASLMMFLGDGKQDWSKKIENAIATGKHLEEMITAERTASATLRSKGVEIDIECSRLEMETKALRESNNVEMMQHEIEISDLHKYLDKLVGEEKEEMQHYEIMRSRAASIVRSAKHTNLKGEMEDCSVLDSATCNPDASDFGEPLSNDFKQNSGSQWVTTADNVTNTLFDTTNFENHTLRKFEDKRAVDLEAGKVPSDIHINQVNQADPNTVDVKTDANLGNYYPLPPSAFGSPLSTNDSPDIMTDCEVSGSELDQSVWSDFSSVVK
uniref:Filament-like plant protein n=1 Tax=Onchocerca flexuosa TaxID=387005 RepID=A0A183HCH8_9BILA